MERRKLARWIAAVIGAAAFVWAVRDRLISVPAPREPEPPRFRTVPPPQAVPMVKSPPLPAAPRPAEEPPAAAPPAAAPDDLTVVVGIGPVYAARLHDLGIAGFSGLAGADPDHLAASLGVTPARVRGWQTQAAGLAT